MKMFQMFLRNKTMAAFLMILIIEMVFLLWDITGRHMVLHDTSPFFYQQYYFLNSLVEYGQIPLWTPFMTHGVGMVSLNAPGFIFDSFVFLGGFLRHLDFFALFYTGLFLYQCVFLSGTWLLSGRYFSSLSVRLFVVVCVASSLVPYTQLLGICVLYVVPLVIWLLHRCMDRGQWRWGLLAAYILGVHCVGTITYTIPVSVFAIFIYFVFDVVIRKTDYERQCQQVKFGSSFWWSAAAFAVLACLIWSSMRLKLDPYTVIGTYLRSADGTVSLQTFLTYAGNTDLNKWNELILRVSPAMDFTLYMGVFALPCVMAGFFFKQHKEARVWTGWTVVMLLINMGSILAVVAFYFWPMMNYYRHLCLLAPVVKFGLCFLAGFGFEAVFCADEKKLHEEKWARRVFFFSMTLIFMGSALFLYHLTRDQGLRNFILGTLVTDGLPVLYEQISKYDLYVSLFVTGGVMLGCLAMIFVRTPRQLAIAALLCLICQSVDVYSYRAEQSRLRTVAMDQGSMGALRWQAIPWRATRDRDTWTEDGRAEIPKKILLKNGVIYNLVGNFLGRDYFSTNFRTDSWSRPYDNYLRAYTGVPLNAPRMVNAQTPSFLNFQIDNPAARKISGLTKDKVQVFTSAYYMNSPEKVANAIADPAYAGDVLILTSYDGHPAPLRRNDQVSPAELAANGRVNAPYKMKFFSPNEVIIETQAPVNHPSWLLYSDTWNPGWQAEVNARPVPVYVANLAYKAVPLVPGMNVVRFYFQSPLLVFLFWFFAAQGLIVLGIFIWLLAGSLFDEIRRSGKGYRPKTRP